MSREDRARVIAQNVGNLADTSEPWEDVIMGIELPDGTFYRVNGQGFTMYHIQLMADAFEGKVTTRKVTIQLADTKTN